MYGKRLIHKLSRIFYYCHITNGVREICDRYYYSKPRRTLFDIHVNVTLSDVQLHAYTMVHLGYYVFKSFIVTCILHCDCFKSSINTNKVVIEIFYSNMLKLQCLSTWILVACETQAQIFKSRFQIPHVQLEIKS